MSDNHNTAAIAAKKQEILAKLKQVEELKAQIGDEQTVNVNGQDIDVSGLLELASKLVEAANED